MSTSANQVTRWWRRGFCLVVAMALTLMCLVLAVAASTTPMTGMKGMADASASAAVTAAPAVAVGAYASGLTISAVGEVAVVAASPVTSLMPQPMSAMRDMGCITMLTEMCTWAVGLTAIPLLALLWASRRETFIGLLARPLPCAIRRRRQTPWTVRSPISLCVLRV